MHDCVQAFVSRREFLDELEKLSTNVEVIYKNGSNTKVEFKLESFEDKVPIVVTLLFKNYASSFPTDITVRDFDTTHEEHDYTQMEQELALDDTMNVFARYIGVRPPTDNIVENILDGVVEEGHRDIFSNSVDGDTSVHSESMDMELD